MVGHPLAHCKRLVRSPASGLQGVALHTGKGELENLRGWEERKQHKARQVSIFIPPRLIVLFSSSRIERIHD